MKPTRLHVAVAALATLAAGCVSQGSYDQLAADKDKEISSLKSQQSTLQGQVQGLQSQKADLEQQKKSLEEQQADLRRQVEALEQQKAQLQTASSQTQSQYDALVKNLSAEVQKGQLQVRQYKDMLTVDVAEQL